MAAIPGIGRRQEVSSELAEFYERAAELFTPGGEGRVDWYMTDSEIVEMLKATNPGYKRTGALFVIATPAGIVAIKPKEPVPAGEVDRGALYPLDLEAELREGRHFRGWSWSPGRNALNFANLPRRIAESFR